MKTNLGRTDRLVRFIIAGLFFWASVFTDDLSTKGMFAILAIFCLYEAVRGWCVVYALAKINTSGKRTKGKK